MAIANLTKEQEQALGHQIARGRQIVRNAMTEVMKADVRSTVTQIVAENLGANHAEVTGDADIQDKLGADSLDMVEIVMEIEDEFGDDFNFGSIPDAEAVQLRTVDQITDWLCKKAGIEA
jgi:acyl carrier protein